MELAASHEQETREQLEGLSEAVDAWMKILAEQAESVDTAQLDAFIETAEKFALRLDEALPPAMESASVAEIRGILIGGLRALRDADGDRPLDVLDDFLVRAESIRHILRDALDEGLPVDPDDVGAITSQLQQWLQRLSKKQIAEILGIEPRTLQRWEAGNGRSTRRALIAVKLIMLLKDAWTPEGVYAWFFRPRRDLDEKRPIDVIDDASYEARLLRAVREGRAQHGQ